MFLNVRLFVTKTLEKWSEHEFVAFSQCINISEDRKRLEMNGSTKWWKPANIMFMTTTAHNLNKERNILFQKEQSGKFDCEIDIWNITQL